MRTLGSMRVTKRAWYDHWGGFANSRCWRRDTNRGWQYFVHMED